MIGVIAAVIGAAVFGLGQKASAGGQSVCDAAPSFGLSCDGSRGSPSAATPSPSTSPSPTICPSPSPSASPTTTPAPTETVTPQPCASAS
jgi:hypothetical protein